MSRVSFISSLKPMSSDIPFFSHCTFGPDEISSENHLKINIKRRTYRPHVGAHRFPLACYKRFSSASVIAVAAQHAGCHFGDNRERERLGERDRKGCDRDVQRS